MATQNRTTATPTNTKPMVFESKADKQECRALLNEQARKLALHKGNKASSFPGTNPIQVSCADIKTILSNFLDINSYVFGGNSRSAGIALCQLRVILQQIRQAKIEEKDIKHFDEMVKMNKDLTTHKTNEAIRLANATQQPPTYYLNVGDGSPFVFNTGDHVKIQKAISNNEVIVDHKTIIDDLKNAIGEVFDDSLKDHARQLVSDLENALVDKDHEKANTKIQALTRIFATVSQSAMGSALFQLLTTIPLLII